MHRADAWDTVLQTLYTTVLDASAWTIALERAAQFMSGIGAQFHVWNVREQRMTHAVLPERFDPASHRRYIEEFAATDPRRRLTERLAPGQWIYDHDHFDSRFIARSPIYQELLIPEGLRYGAGATLHATEEHVVAFALFRTQAQGEYDSEDRRILTRMTPHLIQAATMNLDLTDLQARARSGMSAVDVAPWPVFVLNRSGTIVTMNQSGESALRRSDVVTGSGTRLEPAPMHARPAFARLLDRACATEGPRTGGRLPLRTPARVPLADLLVTPIGEDTPLDVMPDGPHALVVLVSRDTRAGTSVRILRELFALTASEARVMHALCEGASVVDIAETNAVSIQTVRSQLAAVYAKTGTRRQAEVVALGTTLGIRSAG